MGTGLYAVIDIGTNSVRLLLAELSDGNIKGEKQLILTRLGQGLSASGKLSDKAMERTAAAVGELAERARAAKCELPIYCYATSAVREAENGAGFMDMLSNISGLQAEVISGETEALYGYIGARAKGAVMDIGGGSTELIVKTPAGMSMGSVTMGAVTALEAFMESDPPKKHELAALESFCQMKALELLSVTGPIRSDTITGIGGTATQIAMLLLGLPVYDADAVQGFEFTPESLKELYGSLCRMTDEERKGLQGMDPKRSDVIVTGCAIAIAMMQACHVGKLTVSDSDGLEGCLSVKIGLLNT